MPYNTTPLVLHSGVRPAWVQGDSSDRFWYRTTTEKGSEAVLVDPVKATRSACDLPVCQASDRDDPARPPAASRYDELSPDRKTLAFVRDWNLWVRDVASGRETQLTRDGIKDFGYATDNAGWTRSDRPILKWSPDSKKIATFQQDQRERRRDVPGRYQGRPSDAAGVEVPAAGRRNRDDDSARRHRRRARQGRAAADVARPAPLVTLRRPRVPRRVGRRAVGARRIDRRLRVHRTRSPPRAAARWRTRPPARFARCWKRRPRRFSNRATAR